jgi:hypothetical protein
MNKESRAGTHELQKGQDSKALDAHRLKYLQTAVSILSICCLYAVRCTL